MPSVEFISITDVTTKYFNNYITNSLKKHEGLRAICSPRHVSLTNAAFCYKTFFFSLWYVATPSLGRSGILPTSFRRGCVVLQQQGRSWVKGKLLYMCCATEGKGSSKPERTAFFQFWLFWLSLLQLRNPPPFSASCVRAQMLCWRASGAVLKELV